jgi:hypothetical protein
MGDNTAQLFVTNTWPLVQGKLLVEHPLEVFSGVEHGAIKIE